MGNGDFAKCGIAMKGNETKMENTKTYKFLPLIKIEIAELLIVAILLVYFIDYHPLGLIRFKEIGLTKIIIIFSLALSRRIVNALVLCFVCYKQYSKLLKILMFGFFVYLQFAVIVAIVLFDVMSPKVSELYLLIVFVAFLFYFGIIVFKINKEKKEPTAYFCFCFNTFFVFVLLPIYNVVAWVFLVGIPEAYNGG
jgi:hypothetical protein